MHTAARRVDRRAHVPERDLSLVARWLELPRVARWRGYPADSEEAVREHRVVGFALICLDTVPVGYMCWQIPTRHELEVVGLADLPGHLVDIDIFIGQLAATGCGVGSEALNQLCHPLWRKGLRLVGMAVSADKRAACRACDKVGFRPFRPFHEGGQEWHYPTKALDAAA